MINNKPIPRTIIIVLSNLFSHSTDPRCLFQILQPLGNSTTSRAQHSFELLKDGKIVVIGVRHGGIAQLSSVLNRLI